VPAEARGMVWPAAAQLGHRLLFAAFIGTCEAHGNLQTLQPLQLDVDGAGLLKPTNEELDPLRLGEGSCTRQEQQEPLLIVRHRTGATAGSQLTQWIGS
jgi:hypothetical protein